MPDTILHVKATVNSNGHGQRIRKWIMSHYRHIVTSRENAHQSFKRGEISVNGQPSEETRILQESDIVEINYNKTMEHLAAVKDFDIEFGYQDSYMAVIWKAPGINHSFLERAVRYYFESNSPCECIWFPYILQKAASGWIIMAKSNKAKDRLIERYKGNKVQLGMLVLCHGQVPPNLATMEYDTDKLPEEESTAPISKRQNATPNKKDDDNDDEDDDLDVDGDAVLEQGSKIFRSLNVTSVTRSNNSDYISTVELGLRTPYGSASVRRFFYNHGYTIIGNSAATRPIKTHKDKGLYMTLNKLAMDKLFDESCDESERNGNDEDKNDDQPTLPFPIQLTRNEPEKFKLTLEREHRFWKRAYERRLKELQQSGIEMDGASQSLDYVESYGKEPLAYVLGSKEFHGLRFEIDRSCLIPRASTETLVDAALSWLLDTDTLTTIASRKRILDMGTGCGNLLLSILDKAPQAVGIGVDISQQAVAMAQKNKDKILADKDASRATFIVKDMAQVTSTDLKFTSSGDNDGGSPDNDNGFVDLIVCNPPYLNMDATNRQGSNAKDRPTQQQMALSYEPDQALYAEDQGFAWYLTLSELAPRLLASPHGRVILECGKGMMERILVIWSGWKVVSTIKDKQGWDRCLVLERN
ncbi:unnamed protein product [Absidia cylindrospora]